MPVIVMSRGNVTVISVEGKMVQPEDIDAFRQELVKLVADGCRRLVVNLARVPIIGSGGIGALIRCHTEISRSGGTVSIVAATNLVHEALRITGVHRLFQFYESEEEAINAAPRADAAGAGS